MPFTTTWMDLEIITLSEVNQTENDMASEREKQAFWGLLGMTPST